MGDQAVLAFDLGGTRIKAGIVVDHEVVLLRIVPTGDEQGFDHVLEQILSVGEGLLRERPATAIGLSLPAIVDVERGTVRDVRKNLAGLIGFPIVEVLQRRFNLPVAVENDARLYGLGEMVAGAARDVASMVCLTIVLGSVAAWCKMDTSCAAATGRAAYSAKIPRLRPTGRHAPAAISAASRRSAARPRSSQQWQSNSRRFHTTRCAVSRPSHRK